MGYYRVLPRDFFNESKLLKSLGRLVLLVHDGMAPASLTWDHEDPESGFSVEADCDGDLFVANFSAFAGKEVIDLKSSYNSKMAYPLVFEIGEESGFVFDDDGEFTGEFLEVLK